MIFNEQILKRLMKQAWSGSGLTVGNDNGVYLIAASYWQIRIHEDVITNKALAGMIEMLGRLPEEGEIWRAYKDGADQFEIDTKLYDNSELSLPGIEMKVTRVIMEQENGVTARVLQSMMNDQECIVVNDCFVRLIEEAKPEETESEVVGPVRFGNCIRWSNDTCSLVCGRRHAEEFGLDNVLTILSRIEMEEK